jgi:hypothetical protein
MDLSTLDVKSAAERGADLHLEHPTTGEPLKTEDGKNITIRLLGNDSREFRAGLSEIAEKNVGKKRTSFASAEANGIELLARVTVGWQNVTYKGEALKCTPENVRTLYTEISWIKEQVDAFVADRSNFLKFAAKS